MMLTIRPHDRELDLDYFVDTEYAAALDAGMLSQEQDDATRQSEHRAELLEFVDSAPHTGIFVAEDDVQRRVGLVWVSQRERGEAWDLGPSIAWIYDIRVDASARRNGLGTRLLMQAEALAKQNGYVAIGLHVYGSNAPARALYAACGYVPLNTYIQKEGVAACCAYPKDSDAYSLCPSCDDDEVEKLLFGRFCAMARETWPHLPDAQIRDAYEQANQSYANVERDDVTLAVRSTATGAVVGVARAYASSGDLGPTKYAWIRDLVVAADAKAEAVSHMLLGGMARWAAERDLDVLRTSIHGSETDIYATLASEGFVDTNVFLRKMLVCD